MEYSGNELVSYNNNSLMVGGQSLNTGSAGDVIGNDYIPYYPYYPIYEQHYHNWYPSYPIITEKSKIEQGFKVVGKMLENKIITKELTIKEFIKLVNDIAEIL
jgi:hypothetical protein